jgi:hypothetical protein
MPRRIKSTWITRKETPIYCIDFSSLGSDRQSLLLEMHASEAVLCKQASDSLLVAVDLHHTDMMSEIIDFFRNCNNQDNNPVRKMAILGISGIQKVWYPWHLRFSWPKNAAFFDDYEKAKDWLIGECF